MNEAIEDGELGPAMEALNERQRAFVRAVITLGQNGFSDNGLAAAQAGYKGNSESFRVTGYKLMHDTRIQAAIMEETRKRVCLAAAIVATPVLIQIAMNEDLAAKDRHRAAVALMDRGGMPAMTEHKVTVEHRQPKQIVELAARLAAELGVDQQKLIGINRAAAPILEGEYVEVGNGEV